MKIKLIAIALFGAFWTLSAAAQESSDFDEAVDEVKRRAQEDASALFDKYAAALERIQTDFQNKGDLINTVKAREEIRLAKEMRKMGTGDFPGIGKLREIMSAELKKIRSTEIDTIVRGRELHLTKLRAEVAKLTKAGNIDEALALSRRVDAQEAALSADRKRLTDFAGGEAPESVGSVPDPEPAIPRNEKLTAVKSPLAEKEAITGDLVLEPGLHRVRGRGVIGLRGPDPVTKKNVDIQGHVVSNAGTEISGGAVYIHNGTFKANDTKFDGVELMEELQGRWTLKSCLFDSCEFRKTGGWEAGPYSARWHFNDCVFDDSFFTSWGSVGLHVTNCTFHEIKFLPFSYRKDAGTEAVSDGRVIRNCLFVDCTIPASTALATENCLFRNCKFTDDMGTEPKVVTEIEAVLYFEGDQFPKVPKLPDGARLVFKPRSEAGDIEFGSTVRYSIERGKISFE